MERSGEGTGTGNSQAREQSMTGCRNLGPGLVAIMLGSLTAIGTPKPLTAAEAPSSGPTSAADLFLGKVGPLLKQKCLACHGDDPKKLRGKLDLSSRAAML